VSFFWRKKKKRFGMQTMRVPVGRVPQIKHTCEGRQTFISFNYLIRNDFEFLKRATQDGNKTKYKVYTNKQH
jgi:hypothetical protein